MAFAAALMFLWLAVAVGQRKTEGFDRAARGAVHERSPEALTALMRGVTQLGGGWFLWPFGALIVISLAREGRREEAALFGIAVLGAEALNESMKLIFHRPRPDPFFGYPVPDTYSFPSGHSLVSYCFYLALAELLIEPEWSPARKRAAWTAAVFLVLLIGFSRVYLGVHYATDVIAGYLAAIAWTAVARAAHHRWWS